jgi:hypothetical protein
LPLNQTTKHAIDSILGQRYDDIYSNFPVSEVNTIPDFFYCDWLPDKIKTLFGGIIYKKDVIERCNSKERNGCFNHWVGLPTLKNESDEEQIDEYGNPITVDLYGYQKRFLGNYEATNYYAQNKCRGAGTTEIKVVRYNAWKYMRTRIVGRKGLILAGINEQMAVGFLHRIKMLCDIHPEVYLFPPKTDYPQQIFFKQGGSLWGLPASPNAVRSLENIGDVDYDEDAFWSRIDDKPVLKAGEPHVIKSQAHVNHFSTPNGKMKFFWENIFDPECNPPTKYTKDVLNWREVVGIPEPNPLALEDVDFNKPETRQALDKVYLKRYETDKEYKAWFHQTFPNNTIKEILDVKMPIIDVKKIVNLYKTDMSTYQQELDNQFILNESRAFGEWKVGNFNSEEFQLA